MPDRDTVQIVGLREFRRRLRALDRANPRMVRLALNEATQLVVDRATPTIPKRTGRARRSVRVGSTQSTARVRAGGARAPYFGWLDFGGRVGKNRSVERQFRASGRYLYISYYRVRDTGRFADVLDDALRRVAASAGLDLED